MSPRRFVTAAMVSVRGVPSSPSDPRPGGRAGEAAEVVWCLSWAGEAVASVLLGLFVPGLLPCSAGAGSGAGGEVSGGLYRSGRWQAGSSASAGFVVVGKRIRRRRSGLVASAGGYPSGRGLAVFVHRLRFRREAADGSCGRLLEWRLSPVLVRWWCGFVFPGDGGGGAAALCSSKARLTVYAITSCASISVENGGLHLRCTSKLHASTRTSQNELPDGPRTCW